MNSNRADFVSALPLPPALPMLGAALAATSILGLGGRSSRRVMV